ncbi:MAG: inorganic phosphate transporter [Candidatus Saganbacteria bacterium]|nr:inorganic phosphate transporter [Candidatus Saganbacteria bacterium]
MKIVLLIFSVIIFAMSMGASSIAPAFATLFGAKLIGHKKAALWFTLFLLLGAVLAGHNVVKTLGGAIIPSEFLTFDVVLVILLAAVSGLVIANVLRVPESTSWTTVFAISGVGFALAKIETATLWRIVPFWIVLPILGFVITYFLYKIIYPPRFNNLWIYEHIFNKEKNLQTLAFASSCYIAFAAGTNNVANAVGPLVGGGLINPLLGLTIVAVLFGVGGLFFGKRIMKTLGEEIVPLGLISSSLVGIVTASLLLFASLMGIPQSLVQLSALSVMAIGVVKHERHIFREKATRRIFITWSITPVISFSVGFLLTKIFLGV